MSRFLLLLALLAAPFLLADTVQAQRAGFALRAGTAGLGGDIIVGMSNHFHLRASGTYLPYSTTYLQEDDRVDVSYDADAQLFTMAGMLDYYPFRTVVRLSAGVVYNASSVSAIGTPTDSYTTGGRTFTAEQLGTVSTTLDYGSQVQPYVGLGFGNPLAPGNRFGFMLDMGVFYTNAPAVAMEATGMLEPTAQNAADIQAALSPLTIYPAISVAFSVNFGKR
ncbi:MAG: hypothetical protein AAF809_12785 [Bacteroidota bacterium]